MNQLNLIREQVNAQQKREAYKLALLKKQLAEKQEAVV
jgi:hypothetical protein